MYAIVRAGATQQKVDVGDVIEIDKVGTPVGETLTLPVVMAVDGEKAVYVAWTVGSSRALGVKAINAGASAAFKENVRTFSLDDVVPSYGVSSRRIVKTLQASVQRLGVPHPLHVHCNNLGVPGAADSAAATIGAAEGVPLHLAHLQFYGYGTEGRRKFSSAAARLADLVNAKPEVTIDVGQVMFGPTVTISSI